MLEESRLEQLLDLWDEQQGLPHPPTINEFIERYCPGESLELLVQFRDRIRAMAAVDGLLGDCDEPEEELPPTAGFAADETMESEKVRLSAGDKPVRGYRLISLLGKGGFGEVWKAKGPGGFPVALKFVKLDRMASETELRALELARRLRHPHLVAIFGAWQRNGWLLVAMELAGRSLWERYRECVEAGQMGIPQGELLAYLADTAKALDYLNRKRHPLGEGRFGGIQHRDVKPQNLLLCGGSVKLADLGIATFLEGGTAGHTGVMSVAFAPPEFFDGRTSAHSDQYSLAVTYVLLRCGHLPFSGSDLEVMKGHLEGVPDLSRLSEEERPIVARALSKRPEDRWPNCTAFVRALMTSQLRNVAASPSEEESVNHWSNLIFLPFGMLLALAAAASLWLLFEIMHQPPPPPTAAAS